MAESYHSTTRQASSLSIFSPVGIGLSFGQLLQFKPSRIRCGEGRKVAANCFDSKGKLGIQNAQLTGA
jgi:hypothetical protein